MCAAKSNRRKQQGFTLIELFIVVLIVGVLAAVAYPSYTSHVESTRQSAVKAQIMELAAAMEAFRSRNFSYSGAPSDTAITSRTANDFYTVSVTVDASDVQSYTIAAVPVAAKNMNGTETFMLNEQGETCMKVAATCSMATDHAW